MADEYEDIDAEAKAWLGENSDHQSASLVQRLRDERRFPDVDALREQIAADVRRAGRLFDKLSV